MTGIKELKKEVSENKNTFYREGIKSELKLIREVIDVVEKRDLSKYSNLEVTEIHLALEDIRIDLESLL